MPRISLVVMVLCLVTAGAMASEQKIVLDEAHAMHTGNESAPPYNMSPADVLILDISEIDVTPPQGGPPPNTIHIRVTPAGYFRIPLADGTNLYRVDSQAQPLKGYKPLVGFKSGQTVTFAIGHDNFDSMKDGNLQFEVFWAGMIRVK